MYDQKIEGARILLGSAITAAVERQTNPKLSTYSDFMTRTIGWIRGRQPFEPSVTVYEKYQDASNLACQAFLCVWFAELTA